MFSYGRYFCCQLKSIDFDVIAAIESTGFLFGLMIANKMNTPFISIKKQVNYLTKLYNSVMI